MCRRIDAVVDAMASASPEALVGVDHRPSTAIGQDQIVLRDETPEGIVRVLLDAIERRRRIDVPEDHPRPFALELEHGLLEERVVDADSARLDDDIRAAGAPYRAAGSVLPIRVPDDASRPWRIFEVAIGLAIERVRLEE